MICLTVTMQLKLDFNHVKETFILYWVFIYIASFIYPITPSEAERNCFENIKLSNRLEYLCILLQTLTLLFASGLSASKHRNIWHASSLICWLFWVGEKAWKVHEKAWADLKSDKWSAPEGSDSVDHQQSYRWNWNGRKVSYARGSGCHPEGPWWAREVGH